MKILKFREELSKLILSGKKTTTWRLFDDKDLHRVEVVSFVVWESGKEFAHAELISVIETLLGKLTKEDFEGHEPFSSMNEAYDKFSLYYHCSVDENTPVKIIKFSVIRKF